MANFSEEIPRRVNVHRNQPLQPMISISIIRHQINLNALWKGDRSVVAKFPNSSSPLRLCRGLLMAPPAGLVPRRRQLAKRTCRLGLRPELAGRRGCVGGGPRVGGRESSGSPSSTVGTQRPGLAVGDEGQWGPSCRSGRTGDTAVGSRQRGRSPTMPARGRGRSLRTLGAAVWARRPEGLLLPAAPQACLPEWMREERGAREGRKLPGTVGAARAEAGREGARVREGEHGGGGTRDPWKTSGFSPVRFSSFPSASVLVWTSFLPKEIVSSFFLSLFFNSYATSAKR
jgi:hypothetical protein